MKHPVINFRFILAFAVTLFLAFTALGQPFSFAHITDTHIGGSTGSEDLERSVDDINGNPDISFVVVTGDITEFGSFDELTEAKRILTKLNKPWYVVPGNHDSKWSESGCNDFVKVFGSEAFTFEKNGVLFIGTASGPNMRMAPGQVPREHVIYLDSILTAMKNPDQPVILINHYPMDEALANSFEVIEKLKKVNIQAVLLGHGHSNKLFDFEGIPGVMGRSNLRAARPVGGYNIVNVQSDTMYYAEKNHGSDVKATWCKIPVYKKRHLEPGPSRFRPDFSMNKGNASARIIWEVQEGFDIGSGMAASGNICVYANTGGEIIARDIRNGNQLWKYKTGGKIYATPAIEGNKVVCPSTDGQVRCLNLKTGKLLWGFPTGKPIVASPVIENKKVFLGSSEGKFRALSLKKGKLNWQYDSVRNFVETTPLLHDGKIYFGSWGNAFYALDQKSGDLVWKREKYANRMLSPAAVWPVEADGKIFIAAPDRRMTALDAKTGQEIWDSGKFTCRESIGVSEDKALVYIKNMTEGNVFAFDAKSDTQRVVWECKADLGYEIAPTPIVESDGLVFIPTTSGVLHAVDKTSHQVAWKYKLSYALVNPILPIDDRRLLVSTMDGKVFCLRYD